MDYKRAAWETVEYLRIKTFFSKHTEVAGTLWAEKGYTEEEKRELTKFLQDNDYAYANEYCDTEFRLGSKGYKLTLDDINKIGKKPGNKKKILWIAGILITIGFVICFSLFGFYNSSIAWYRRGDNYLERYNSDFQNHFLANSNSNDQTKKSASAYFETPVTNLFEATNSLLRAKELQLSGSSNDKLEKKLGACYFHLQNAAISRFNHKKYGEAYLVFDMAVKIAASDQKFDSLNISNAASSAFNSENYEAALVNYKKLVSVGYKNGNSWLMLARTYEKSGDEKKYNNTISEALLKYPDDADLLRESVNIKMHSGRAAEAIKNLEALILQYPDDPELNFVLGNLYDRMANPTRPDGASVAKPANYEDLLGKAVIYYTKAIELNPRHADACYNLGVLYYNQSVEYYSRSQQPAADAGKYRDMWKRPLPSAKQYLEMAYALNPKDLSTLRALKTVYSQMSDETNYERISDELLQAGG